MLKCEICNNQVQILTKNSTVERNIYLCANCFWIMNDNPLLKFSNRKKNEIGLKNKLYYNIKQNS